MVTTAYLNGESIFFIKKSLKKKWQRGLSLIEAAMVLALSAVVVAGVMAYYQSASTNDKTERTIGEIMAIISAVNSTYSSAPDFSGLSENQIAYSGALPASFIDHTDPHGFRIISPFGYNISISAGLLPGIESAQHYTLYLGVPRSVCPTLVRLDLGSSLVRMAIGSPDNLVKIPVSVEDSQKLCETAKSEEESRGADVVLIFYSLH